MRILIAVALSAIHGIALGQGFRIEGEAGAANLLRIAKAEFERARPGARLESVHANSTAGALSKLCRGMVGIVGAARQMSPAEQQECAHGQVTFSATPIALDGLSLVVNPANTWAKQLSAAQVRRIWQEAPGKPTQWRQLDVAWPAASLKLYGPAPKLALADHARAVFAAAALRGDMSATELPAVTVEAVARDREGIGLVDRATYAAYAKRVRLVPIEDGHVFPIFLYSNAKMMNDPASGLFVQYLIANAPRLAAQAGLSPYVTGGPAK